MVGLNFSYQRKVCPSYKCKMGQTKYNIDLSYSSHAMFVKMKMVNNNFVIFQKRLQHDIDKIRPIKKNYQKGFLRKLNQQVKPFLFLQ